MGVLDRRVSLWFMLTTVIEVLWRRRRRLVRRRIFLRPRGEGMGRM